MLLIKLAKWLSRNNLHKEAQKVEDLAEYEESWHEEVVQEFGEEPVTEEEYYKKELQMPSKYTDYYYPIYKLIMEQEGFEEVSVGGKSSFVGAGLFGHVFRGIYQGKPAVIKIVLLEGRYSSKEDEVKNWRRILKAADNLPPQMLKHIPKIYKLNKGTVNLEPEKEEKFAYKEPYSIVIMEELRPLPFSMRAFLGRFSTQFVHSVDRLLKDENFLFEFAKHILERLKNFRFSPVHTELFGEDITNKVRELKNTSPIDLVKYLLSINNFSSFDSKKITEGIMNFVAQKEGFDSGLTEFLINNMYIFVTKAINPDLLELPSSSTRMYRSKEPGGYGQTPVWSHLPETNTLLEMLTKLADDFQIKFEDLHTQNIMMDNEGNLKIIDVGLYR